MPPPLPERRQLLRRLHEHYHVPLDMLATLGAYEPGTVQHMADIDGWRTRSSANALRAQLTDVLFRAIVAMEGSDEEAAAAERTLKHIGTVSKAVETLAIAESHLNKADGQTDLDKDDEPSLAVGGGAAIAQLDRMAAELARDFDAATTAHDAGVVEAIPDPTVAHDEPTGAEQGNAD